MRLYNVEQGFSLAGENYMVLEIATLRPKVGARNDDQSE